MNTTNRYIALAFCAVIICAAPAVKAAPTTNVSPSSPFDQITKNNVTVSISCIPEATSTCSIYACADLTNTCTPANQSTSSYSITISNNGTTSLRFYSQDELGNADTLQSKNVIIDNVPPSIVFSNLPGASTGINSVNITVGGDGVVAYKYYLDYGAESPEYAISSNISVTGLSIGSHHIGAIGRDNAGNWQSSPTAYSWSVIESSAPQATLSNLPSSKTTATNINVTVGGTDITKYKFKIDNDSYGSETLIATKISISDLDKGTHILYVLGMNANNVWQTTPTQFQWEIEESSSTNTSDSHAGKTQMYKFPENLEEGDTGSMVTELQKRLKYEGFFSGAVTAKFDTATVSALKEYQSENKLPQTGILDTRTRTYMNDHAPWVDTATANANSGKVRMYQFTKQLEEGDSGTEVAELQKRLKYEGFYKGSPSGRFDSATTEALKEYQSENRLSRTGILDTKTREYMNEKAPWVSPGQATSQIVPLIKKEFKVMKWKGIKNDEDVKALQQRLKEEGIYKWAINGNYDVFTEYAVKYYQWKNKLSMTGWLDYATMAFLNKTAAVSTGGTNAGSGVFQFNTPKSRGATSDNDVKELQKRLAALGIYKWAINGNYDVFTEYAVMYYQWKNKLVMTGKLDAATMALLNKTAAATATTAGKNYAGIPREMKLGDQGTDVLDLQIKLGKEGFFSRTKTGIFDENTENALRSLQKEYKLPVSGTLNQQTREKLKLIK